MSKRKHEAVEVFWLDSHSVDGWHGKPKAKIELTRSVGILVKKTRHSVVIALAHDASAAQPYCCALTIPRAAVRSVRRLRT